jgi:Putative adhesin
MSVTNSYQGVKHVVVDNFGSGWINIEGDSRQDLVAASIDAADDRFLEQQVEIRHDHDWLRISFPPQVLRSTKAYLCLSVPDGLTYVIKTGSADISIGADIGRSKIISGSGDITIANAVDLDCSTGSGNISVARLDGNGARLSSGSGSVSVEEVNCPTTAKSGSGDIVVKSLRGANFRAGSGSGDIAVSATSGSVDLRSASGSFTVGVADNLPAWLDLSSVSGDIRIGIESTNKPEPGEPYITVRARTASGDIAIYRA